jgi:hypothetical protein
MKIILLVMLMLLMNNPAFALDELHEIMEALNELHRPEMRGGITKFILANKDTSQKDSKRMKLLDRASEIIFYDLSKKYDARPEDYGQKILNKKDRELYKTILDLNRKRAIRNFLLCNKGNEEEARKSADKSRALKQKAKGLEPNSKDAMEIDEQILQECKYDDSVMWGLLATYRFKQYREKYNKLMLRIIQEDQVEYDYSGSPTDDISGRFSNEFKSFLGDVNSLYKEPILTKEQVRLVAEAVLAKYQEVFKLDNIPNVEDAFYIVQPMVVLPYWLDYYKLGDLRTKYIDTFFGNDLVKETLKAYSDVKGFKDILDYLERV